MIFFYKYKIKSEQIKEDGKCIRLFFGAKMVGTLAMLICIQSYICNIQSANIGQDRKGTIVVAHKGF